MGVYRHAAPTELGRGEGRGDSIKVFPHGERKDRMDEVDEAERNCGRRKALDYATTFRVEEYL